MRAGARACRARCAWVGAASLANDDTIALRVRFPDGRVPPPEAMYFRGPVLSAFDGREWTRLPPALTPSSRSRSDVQLLGAPVRYEVTLEPSRMALLPLLELTPDRADAAPAIDGHNATLRPDLQWQLNLPVTDRLRFEGAEALAAAPARAAHGSHRPACPDGAAGGEQPAPGGLGTRLPGVGSAAFPRRRARWPRRCSVTSRPPATPTRSSPGPTVRTRPTSSGWDCKLGFCEHFASTFVIIMRHWGVPARLVTGYQGTDPDPVDGWWVVRQSHAHAWAEYWQPGEGWVRADPTASVAPERIRRSRTSRSAAWSSRRSSG